MSIKPWNLYSIEKWKTVITQNDCDNVIDAFLHTICYNYYNNSIVIDLLLQKYKDKSDITNKVLLYIINNIPCYNLNKYVKLYNKSNNTKFKPSKQLTSLITSLWAFESFINKKNFNTFENEKLKLLKSKSVNKWLEYFNYLLNNRDNISDFYIINTFERFLQITPSYLKVWILYIDFTKRTNENKPENVFILYQRLNSIRTINTFYSTMDPKLKNYLRLYYMDEIKMWKTTLIHDESLCKKVDIVSSLFKIVKNLKNNNDSLDAKEINQLLLVYLDVLNKHLNIKYKNRFIEILGTLINEFGFKNECEPKIKNYLTSKNLNNFFCNIKDSPSNLNLMATFSKFVIKKLLSNVSTDTISKNTFSLYLKDFVYNQNIMPHSNQIITYNNLKKLINKYGTIDDYRNFILFISKLQAKNKKPVRRLKPKPKNIIRRQHLKRKIMQ